MPQVGWLQAIRETFQYFPEVAMVRGCDGGWFAKLFPQTEPGRVGSGADIVQSLQCVMEPGDLRVERVEPGRGERAAVGNIVRA